MKLWALRMGVFKSMVLQREVRSRGRKNCKRVLMAVAFQASAKPICIHYNKKWKAPSEKFERGLAYQLPLNFLLFKRTLVPSSVLIPRAPVPPRPRSLQRSSLHPPSPVRGHSRHSLPRRYPPGRVSLTFFFRCGAKAKMRGIWSSPNAH